MNINSKLIKNPIKEIDFTLASGITKEPIYTTEIIHDELTKRVTLFFGLNGNFVASAYTHLLTFDPKYAPKKEVMNNAYAAVNNNIAVRVLTTGIVNLYGGGTTQTIARGQISWYI